MVDPLEGRTKSQGVSFARVQRVEESRNVHDKPSVLTLYYKTVSFGGIFLWVCKDFSCLGLDLEEDSSRGRLVFGQPPPSP